MTNQTEQIPNELFESLPSDMQHTARKLGEVPETARHAILAIGEVLLQLDQEGAASGSIAYLMTNLITEQIEMRKDINKLLSLMGDI